MEVRRDDEVLAQLGPGDFFGEMALLDRGVRNATVTASEPCTLMVMTPSEFRAMADAMPSVATELRRAMEERGAAVAARA